MNDELNQQPSPPVADQPVPANVPPAPVPTQAAPPAGIAPKNPPDKKKLLLTGAVLIAFLGIFSVIFLRMNGAPVEQPQTEITPTPELTPTPLPNLSRISATEAFAAFVQENASFSGVLQSFVLQDPSLTPPVFDIELDLTP